MRFDGTVAFITGGGSGLGEAAAQRFADEGAAVVLGDINEPVAQKVAARLPHALAVAVDVSDASLVQRAIASTVERYGRLDVVFDNAGIPGSRQMLHEMDVANWDRVPAVNGDGLLRPEVRDRGHAAHRRRQHRQHLVDRRPHREAQHPPYTFAQVRIVGLTRSAAVEYAAHDIRVNAFAPTVVRTPLVEDVAHTAPDPAAMREAMQNYNPVLGMPTPEDVAAAVAFLASDEARWITGHTLPIDGGYCAR